MTFTGRYVAVLLLWWNMEQISPSCSCILLYNHVRQCWRFTNYGTFIQETKAVMGNRSYAVDLSLARSEYGSVCETRPVWTD